MWQGASFRGTVDRPLFSLLGKPNGPFKKDKQSFRYGLDICRLL